MGADETINYTEQDFEEVIKEQTSGNGVELILECVGGPVAGKEPALRCILRADAYLRQRFGYSRQPARR